MWSKKLFDCIFQVTEILNYILFHTLTPPPAPFEEGTSS